MVAATAIVMPQQAVPLLPMIASQLAVRAAHILTATALAAPAEGSGS